MTLLRQGYEGRGPAAITSSAVRSAFVAAPSVELPRLTLGLGPFTFEESVGTRAVQLRDARGEACGLFVNKQLAAATASHLSQ